MYELQLLNTVIHFIYDGYNITAVRMNIIIKILRICLTTITIIVTAVRMEDCKLEISDLDKEWLPSI